MQINTTTYHLKDFNNQCCYKWLNHCLLKENINAVNILDGSVEIKKKDQEKAKEIIKEVGFSILKDKNLIKIETIKQAIFEIVYLQDNQNSIIQKSEYLIERLGMSYSNISKLFSRYENITLERFIIQTKIKKVKDLILYENYTLSEIAYLMDYSSVQHLSNQFKKETGFSVSDFKKQM